MLTASDMYAHIHKSDHTSVIIAIKLSRARTTLPNTVVLMIGTVLLVQLKAIIAIAKRTWNRKTINSRLSRMFRKHQITEITITRCIP